MSRLSNFANKPKIVEVEGEEFKVYPLKVEDEHLFKDCISDNAAVAKKARVELIMKSLKDEKDITEDEIDLPVFNKFANVIMDVNGYAKQLEQARKQSA